MARIARWIPLARRICSVWMTSSELTPDESGPHLSRVQIFGVIRQTEPCDTRTILRSVPRSARACSTSGEPRSRQS